MTIYVSHPRNGGTELARQIAQMLGETLGATIYFPESQGRGDDLGQADAAKLAEADVILIVLNRESSRYSVPLHVSQLELRRATSRATAPTLIVVRAEPCPIPEPAQTAELSLAGHESTQDEIVSRIAELLLSRSQRDTGGPGPALRDYLERLASKHGVWSSRYTRLGADIAGFHPAQRPLIQDASTSEELDALLAGTFAPLSATLQPAWTGTDTSARRVPDVRDVLYAHRRLTLVGEPGAGKSTTVRSLTADLAMEALRSNDSTPVPVLVSLGTLASTDIDQAINEALAPATIRDFEGREPWIILDGLNETTKENVEKITRWIKANPQTRLILTSRRAHYETLRLPLVVAELRPLSVTDIPTFLVRWGLNHEDAHTLFWALAGVDVERIWHKWEAVGETLESFWTLRHARDSKAFRTTNNFDDDAYDDMRRRMIDEGKPPGLLDVVTSPFLLTLTLAIYNRQHELPRRRAELFEKYVDALFQHLGHAELPRVERARRVLAQLAGAMNDKESTSVARADVGTMISVPDRGQIDAAMQLGQEASILDLSGERVRFTHQLLQDHFGAFALAGMLAQGESPSRVWREDRRHWWSPMMWDEAAVLLTGLVGYHPEVSARIASPWDVVGWITPINPIVAWRCVEENRLDVDHPRAQVLRRPTRGNRAAPRARVLLVPEFADIVGTGTGVLPDGIPDIAWLLVPAGEFVFGRDKIVDLPEFWIARFPVTNRQFDVFTRSPSYLDTKYWSGLHQVGVATVSLFPGPTNPRDSVNWYEARAFCRWLHDMFLRSGDERVTSGQYEVRLPTEREWEKAARGTQGNAYPWGSTFDPTHCNVLETDLRKTSPVGMFPDGASPYGVEDMAGNVWEWCSDRYITQNRTAFGVVNRGGSCFRDSIRARTTYRGDCLPGYHSSGRGFRVVLAPPLSRT